MTIERLSSSDADIPCMKVFGPEKEAKVEYERLRFFISGVDFLQKDIYTIGNNMFLK